MRINIYIISVLCLFFLANTAVGKEKSTVFVSIVPQKFFVQQISEDILDVQVMVEPGADPHTYEPKVSQMKKLNDTSLYFSIGVPFEGVWLPKIAEVNPDMVVVKTDEGLKKRKMAAHHHHDDEGHHDEHEGDRHDAAHEGEDHAAEEQGMDPHVWLSPELVKEQVSVIRKSLVAKWPEHKVEFDENSAKFLAEIEALDDELKARLAGSGNRQFMVFHPSWGYWADNYGLTQIPVEIEGKAPKPAQLIELIKHAKEQGIKVIFAQPQFSKKSAELIAKEIGGEVILIDPLAENWLSNMREIAEQFTRTVN